MSDFDPSVQPSEPEGERTLQGRRVGSLSGDDRAAILAEACEYRGDVTLHLADGRCVVGYVFASEAADETLRLFPKDSAEKVTLAHGDVVAIEFSGEDKAFGRSWEAWIRRRDRVAGSEDGSD